MNREHCTLCVAVYLDDVFVYVCVCVFVCVQALYGTLVDLNDIALQLFMMGVELNEKINKIKKNRMRREGVWWWCDRGEEIPVDFVLCFFFFFLPPSASQKKRRRAGISFENISSPAFLPSSSLHLLAPLLLALFLLSHRRSLFMLWTANQWAELFRGLNYAVILGFCLLCPSFFALTSSGILSW